MNTTKDTTMNPSQQSKHTPGEWTISAAWQRSIGVWNCHVNRGTQGVATVHGTTEAECLANARLIAAAPELYSENERLKAVNSELVEALGELLTAFRQVGSQRDYDTYSRELHQAQEAIHLAQG